MVCILQRIFVNKSTSLQRMTNKMKHCKKMVLLPNGFILFTIQWNSLLWSYLFRVIISNESHTPPSVEFSMFILYHASKLSKVDFDTCFKITEVSFYTLIPSIELCCIVFYSDEFGQIIDAIGDMVDELRPDPFIPAYWR